MKKALNGLKTPGTPRSNDNNGPVWQARKAEHRHCQSWGEWASLLDALDDEIMHVIKLWGGDMVFNSLPCYNSRMSSLPARPLLLSLAFVL